MGEIAFQSRTNKKQEEQKKKVKSLENLLGEIPKDEEEEKIERIEFELFETLEDIYETYKILLNYLQEGYGIDSNLLLRLIDEDKMPVKRTLEYIAYIHSGFLEVALET